MATAKRRLGDSSLRERRSRRSEMPVRQVTIEGQADRRPRTESGRRPAWQGIDGSLGGDSLGGLRRGPLGRLLLVVNLFRFWLGGNDVARAYP